MPSFSVIKADIFNLLVVEDRDADICLLQRAFQKAGVHIAVHYVKDGQEALDYLQGSHQYADRKTFPMPMMVLLDLKMPRLDGFEVLAWLKAHPLVGNLIIIILSASENTRDINRAYSLGANSYLQKPSSPGELPGILRSLEHYWRDFDHFSDNYAL